MAPGAKFINAGENGGQWFSKLANLGRSNDNFALLGSGASPAPEKQYGTPSMPQKKYDTQVDMYNGGDDQL